MAIRCHVKFLPNPIEVVTFPTGMVNNSSSAVDNLFIDRSYLANCDNEDDNFIDDWLFYETCF